MSDEKSLVTINPEALIAQGIDKGLPVETMERLLAMRRELKEEYARESYYSALMAFQKACPIIAKTKKVMDGSGRLLYKYAPIEEVIKQIGDLFEKHGFSYSIQSEQEAQMVTAICHIHHIDGHSESSKFAIPVDPKGYMNAAQKVASALTYGKRYAFLNGFGILTGDEDDDSRGTTDPPKTTTKKSTTFKDDPTAKPTTPPPKQSDSAMSQLQKDFLAEIEKLPTQEEKDHETAWYDKHKDEQRTMQAKLDFMRQNDKLRNTGGDG